MRLDNLGLTVALFAAATLAPSVLAFPVNSALMDMSTIHPSLTTLKTVGELRAQAAEIKGIVPWLKLKILAKLSRKLAARRQMRNAKEIIGLSKDPDKLSGIIAEFEREGKFLPFKYAKASHLVTGGPSEDRHWIQTLVIAGRDANKELVGRVREIYMAGGSQKDEAEIALRWGGFELVDAHDSSKPAVLTAAGIAAAGAALLTAGEI